MLKEISRLIRDRDILDMVLSLTRSEVIMKENQPLKLGDSFTAIIHGSTITGKVWGFVRDRKKLIVEVIINDISIAKLILTNKNGVFESDRYPRFVSDYKRLTVTG